MSQNRSFAPVLAGFVVGWMAWSAGAQTSQVVRGPTIAHDPVRLAIRGQSLTILAHVDPGAAPLKRVTLHYTMSRDAAPSQLPMTGSSGHMYVATIPAHHFATAQALYYYIEAVDKNDEWKETRYLTVPVQGPNEPVPPPTVVQPATTSSTTPKGGRNPVIIVDHTPDRPDEVPVSRTDGSGGLTRGQWLAGGAVVAGVVGIAVAASSDSGGGGGDDTTPAPPPADSDGDMDPGAGTGMEPFTACAEENTVGTWLNADASVAPGFRIGADGTAQFFAAEGELPDTGTWGLVDCELTLIPSDPNSVYRGTGQLNADQTVFTLDDLTFTQ